MSLFDSGLHATRPMSIEANASELKERERE